MVINHLVDLSTQSNSELKNNDAHLNKKINKLFSHYFEVLNLVEELNEYPLNCKSLLVDVKKCFDAYSTRKINLEEFKGNCQQLANTIEQLPISKYEGYTGLTYALTKLAFLLVSICTIGIANGINYCINGSFVFFNGNKTLFKAKGLINELEQDILETRAEMLP